MHAARPTLAWFRDDVPAAPGAAVVGAPGTRVGDGRYEVLRLVGAGGMGQVYQAHDLVLERHVALKIMRAEVPASERRRFRREALLGARLLHPSLVRVYDMGFGVDGEAAWAAGAGLPEAVRLATREAHDLIRSDTKQAVEIYKEITGDKTSVEDLLVWLKEPGMMEWNLEPQGTMKFADHLFRTGTLKTKPKAWTDYYLPLAHDLKGS